MVIYLMNMNKPVSKKGQTAFIVGFIVVIVVIIIGVRLLPTLNNATGSYTGTSKSLLDIVELVAVAGLVLLAVFYLIGRFGQRSE